MISITMIHLALKKTMEITGEISDEEAAKQ